MSKPSATRSRVAVVGDLFVAVAVGDRSVEVCGDDEYDAACKLAAAVGVELDG